MIWILFKGLMIQRWVNQQKPFCSHETSICGKFSSFLCTDPKKFLVMFAFPQQPVSLPTSYSSSSTTSNVQRIYGAMYSLTLCQVLWVSKNSVANYGFLIAIVGLGRFGTKFQIKLWMQTVRNQKRTRTRITKIASWPSWTQKWAVFSSENRGKVTLYIWL